MITRDESDLTPTISGRTARRRRPLVGRLKGQQTRSLVIDAALGLAATQGLEGLTIGAVADATQMSKSGVFAHFGSREEMQISVVKEYHQRFEEEVVRPALTLPRGLPRLVALFQRWVRRVNAEIESGCIYVSGAVEFDDRPGPVRDALARMVLTGRDSLRRAVIQAQEMGHLRAAVDPDQLVFEIHGIVLALHHDARFLRVPGAAQRAQLAFARVIDEALTPEAPSPGDFVASALSAPSLPTTLVQSPVAATE